MNCTSSDDKTKNTADRINKGEQYIWHRRISCAAQKITKQRNEREHDEIRDKSYIVNKKMNRIKA